MGSIPSFTQTADLIDISCLYHTSQENSSQFRIPTLDLPNEVELQLETVLKNKICQIPHASKVIFHCQTCDQYLCLDCSFSHEGHNLINLETLCSQTKDKFSNLRFKADRLLCFWKNLKENYDLKHVLKELDNKIKVAYDILIEEIKSHRDTILSRIKTSPIVQSLKAKDKIFKANPPLQFSVLVERLNKTVEKLNEANYYRKFINIENYAKEDIIQEINSQIKQFKLVLKKDIGFTKKIEQINQFNIEHKSIRPYLSKYLRVDDLSLKRKRKISLINPTENTITYYYPTLQKIQQLSIYMPNGLTFPEKMSFGIAEADSRLYICGGGFSKIIPGFGKKSIVSRRCFRISEISRTLIEIKKMNFRKKRTTVQWVRNRDEESNLEISHQSYQSDKYLTKQFEEDKKEEDSPIQSEHSFNNTMDPKEETKYPSGKHMTLSKYSQNLKSFIVEKEEPEQNLQNYLFCVGGEDQNGYLNQCEIYNMKANFWDVHSFCNEKKSNPSLTIFNNAIAYCFGGRNKSFLSTIEKCEIFSKDRKWEYVHINGSKLCSGSLMGSFQLPGDQILIFGGLNKNYLSNSYIFKVNENELEETEHELLTEDDFLGGSIYYADNKIYAIGENKKIIQSFGMLDYSWNQIDCQDWKGYEESISLFSRNKKNSTPYYKERSIFRHSFRTNSQKSIKEN